MSSNSIYGVFPNTNEGPFHYLYRITNMVEQKYYYGIRTSKNILPHHDLGVKYFSSSSDKVFISDQKEHPENYRYKIIRITDIRKKVAELEIKIHKKFNVGDNTKFYNRVIQSSSKFDSSGKVTVKDKNGNSFLVSLTDEKYLSGELQHNLKGHLNGKLIVKDEFGNTSQVSIDDPRYLSGELQHVLKGKNDGKVSVRDEFGHTYKVSVDDPRYLSGELQHVLKNRISVRDEFGHTYKVSVDDPRYLSGELHCVLKGITNGKVSVKDGFGNTSQVSIGDERYLSGELKGVNCGKKWIHNSELKQNKIVNPVYPLPNGWFCGYKNYNTTNLGTKGIYNLKLKKNMRLKPGEELPDGWQYGLKRSWE